MTKNKKILNNLIRKFPGIKKLTYIELGIFLQTLGYDADWVSLGEAHDYLGNYKDDNEDNKIKQLLNEANNLEIDKIILDKALIKEGN